MRQSRLIVVGALCGYFCLVAAEGWRKLGVPSLTPSFADMRFLTSTWECARRHVHVYTTNPCDVWRRPFDYPRVLLLPARLGLGHGSAVLLAVLAAAVFFLAALVLVRNRLDAVVVAAALCSPSVMLAVERGNVDLVVFALVVAAVVWRRGSVLVLLAAVLKLFPIFAALVLLRRRRLFAFAATLAGFGAYALATLGDIRLIGKAVPHGTVFSYGFDLSGGHHALALRGLELLAAYAVLRFAFAARGAIRSELVDGCGERELDLFWAGAAIYVGTFLLFRSFDYRLMFLVLAVPQLVRWARRRSPLAILTLAALLGTLWHLAAPAAAVFQLLTFAGVVSALVATLPSLRGAFALAAPAAPALRTRAPAATRSAS